MGTLQNPNPSPNPYPIRNPHPQSNPTSNPTSGATPPSFEVVSELFSLPLSDAADSLGVCPSVLKKACYDNGLVRWPYRKFLAGKSIEDIKKDAAIEKEKKVTAIKVTGERHDPLASSVVSSSLAPQPTSTGTISFRESPTSRILIQQPTNKDNPTDSFPNTLGSTMNKGMTSSISDEFKYGFPSAGLTSVSFRWWGNKGNAEDHARQNGNEDAKEMKQQCKDSIETPATDADADILLENANASEGKKNETDAATQWAVLLTSLRKKAVEEGRRALKLGVYRGFNTKTLDQTKKTVLLQIFKSSLPDEWGDVFSEG